MIMVEEEQTVPYSDQRMYALVNDVESYPEFLPWCTSAQVVEADEHSMVAQCQMRFAGYKLSFTTRNSLVPGKSISMSLLRGAFDSLVGNWEFTAITGQSCRISLKLKGQLKGRLLRRLVEPILLQRVQALVRVFTARAHQLYGDSSGKL